MKSITVEITKRIVVTVEAKDYPDACRILEYEMSMGDHNASWHQAEPGFDLLDIAEGETT